MVTLCLQCDMPCLMVICLYFSVEMYVGYFVKHLFYILVTAEI